MKYLQSSPAERLHPQSVKQASKPFFLTEGGSLSSQEGADEEFTIVSITLNVPPYAFFIFLNYCLVSNKSTGQEAES